jgi:molecular chaperone IbpA
MARDLYASLFNDPRFLGFSSLFRDIDNILNSTAQSYPPYNIEALESDEDGHATKFRLVMAVAGFGSDDITVSVVKDCLSVEGDKKADESKRFVYRGIANRSFHQKFKLAEHTEVVSADLKDGILVIDLERRLPEAEKPRLIPIGRGDSPPQLVKPQLKAAE